MTNIIFLDIDGPLLPGRAYFLPENKNNPFSVWDTLAIGIIEGIRDSTDAKYVISSAWATAGLDEMKRIFSEQGFNTDHFHDDWITPRKFTSHRSTEIMWWLDNHPETTKWIAFDDDAWNHNFDAKYLKNGRVIEVDFDNGISVNNFKDALVIFDLKRYSMLL